uniref:C-type lectin domain-containing protein n=1 Tax=Stegastes partitus TaxID=144197 RepID=A0A3B5BIC0_9TELE
MKKTAVGFLTLALLLFYCRYKSSRSEKTYTLIQRSMNCKDAQAYCRTHHTDLAMIENDQENTQMSPVLLPNIFVLIGLYQVSWEWSIKSSSSFTNWTNSEAPLCTNRPTRPSISRSSTTASRRARMKFSFFCRDNFLQMYN